MTQPQRAQGSRLRTRAAAAGLDTLGRMLRLPPTRSRYTVNPVQIPMRDGVILLADHYFPSTASPAGTIVVRCPYGRSTPFSLVFASLYAARGYHVVLQSVRGTFGSGGVFEPMANEAADGTDTVVWLREQPWFGGRFATIGLSYLGFTQWALLNDPPPELAAAVITVGPHDFWDSTWRTGAFSINDFLGWSDMVSRQENRRKALIRQLTGPRAVAHALRQVPVGPAARRLLGTGGRWFESWVQHPDADDPFWQPRSFPAALERVQVPVLLLSGWQDLFLRQTLAQYHRLHERGLDVALTIGPWTHTQMITKGLGVVTRESLDWLDTHLGHAPARQRASAVNVFITGQGWKEMPSWPPPTRDKPLYLQPRGALGWTEPSAEAPPATFRSDPADPTPVAGGPLLSPQGGYRDDTSMADRADVLTFTSDPLPQDLCVFGSPVAELRHSADNPNVDVLVRISEVDPAGRSQNVTDGYLRLSDATDATTVRLDLEAIAHRFTAGSRIRVLVAGSWFPRYSLNLGAGEPTLSGTRIVPARHSVHFGPSRVLLPAHAD